MHSTDVARRSERVDAAVNLLGIAAAHIQWNNGLLENFEEVLHFETACFAEYFRADAMLETVRRKCVSEHLLFKSCNGQSSSLVV